MVINQAKQQIKTCREECQVLRQRFKVTLQKECLNPNCLESNSIL